MKPLYVIYCLFIFSVSCYNSNAQIVKSLSFKEGMSFANQNWNFKHINVSNKRETLQGAFSGIEIEFLRGKFLSFSTEFSYCKKGHKVSIPFTNSDMPDGNGELIPVKFRFNYMSFSPQLSTRYKMKKWTSYVSLGPRIDQLYWSFVDQSNLDNSDRQTIVSNKTMFGMNVSTGLEYTLHRKSIFIEAKYLHDFTKAIDNANLSVKNRAFVVCLGLRFNFVKE